MAFAIVLVAGACGGGSPEQRADAADPDGATTTTVAGESPGSGPDADGGEGSPTTTPGTRGGGASGGASAPSTSTTVPGGTQKSDQRAKPKPKLPVEVTLASPCVRAGETQTITFKTVPGAGVAYNSWYADGKNGLDEGFYGGNAGSPVDPEGTWTDTWIIAPHAPPGKVRVTYGASHIEYSAEQSETSFVLVGPAGSCS